jgi:hypothetical protein
MVRCLMLCMVLLCSLASAQRTEVPSDHVEPPILPGITPVGGLALSGAALANFDRGVSQLCATAAALPAGPEKTAAEDACAYMKVLRDLRKVGVGDLGASNKAATLPDYLVYNSGGALVSGCWTPRRRPGVMNLFPNWLVFDDDELGPTGPYRQGASCFDRFRRYNVLVHEASRARRQKFEFESGVLPNKDNLLAQIEAFADSVRRIDSALTRGGMPATSDEPACTFIGDDIVKLNALRDRMCGRVRGLCAELARRFPTCPTPAACGVCP